MLPPFPAFIKKHIENCPLVSASLFPIYSQQKMFQDTLLNNPFFIVFALDNNGNQSNAPPQTLLL